MPMQNSSMKAATDVGVIMLVGLVIVILLVVLIGIPFFTGESKAEGFGFTLTRTACDWLYFFLGPPCAQLGFPPRIINSTNIEP